jgi:type IV pilus assembly protein PilV
MTRRAIMSICTSKTPARKTLLVARRHLGASMIEILVSVLLVSVGLLGIAGLSGATFGYNKASQVRLTGIALANDLADRARVNIYGYDLRAYDIELSDVPSTTPVVVPDANLDLSPADLANATAVANGLAAADVDEFLRNVSNGGGESAQRTHTRP